MDKLTHLTNANTSLGQLLPSKQTPVHNARAPAPSSTNLMDAELVAFSSNKVVSMKIIFHAINQRFIEHKGFDRPIQTPGFNASSESNDATFDSDKVTETVFGFIKDSLLGAKENGTSDKKLQAMFEQAKEGVTLGFGEALQELSELNTLTDEIRQGVTKSQEDISRHIDALYPSFFHTEEKVKGHANNVKLVLNNLVSTQHAGIANRANLASTVEKFNGSYRYSDSRDSDLTITTNDGDEVKISFYSNDVTGVNVNYHNNGQSLNERFAISAGSGKEAGFSIAIEGELNDEEREAIMLLLKDIDRVQESFYSGNINKAYEYAQRLALDSRELTRMSLDLQQTQTFHAKDVYQEVAAIGHQHPAKDKSLRPILDFVAELRVLTTRASETMKIEHRQFREIFQQFSIAKFAEDAMKSELLNELVSGIVT